MGIVEKRNNWSFVVGGVGLLKGFLSGDGLHSLEGIMDDVGRIMSGQEEGSHVLALLGEVISV